MCLNKFERLRFYAKNIIDSLENLNRNYLVNFEIKPENFLITINLIIKISDFSLVANDNDIIKITIDSSYLTPEYYYNREKVSNDAQKNKTILTYVLLSFFSNMENIY